MENSQIPSTEWATDYWGVIETEPSEEHARKVADAGNVSLYRRAPMGAWIKESRG